MWKKDLKEFTKTRADRLDELTGIYPTETVLDKFVTLVEKSLYKQIIFEYGYIYLEVVLSFGEARQSYGVCAEIIKQLEEDNKTKSSPTKLEIW